MSFEKRYKRALAITAPWSSLLFLISTFLGFIPLGFSGLTKEYQAETFIRYQEPQKEKNDFTIRPEKRSSVNQSALTKETLLLNKEFLKDWEEKLSPQSGIGPEKGSQGILNSEEFVFAMEPQVQSQSEPEKTQPYFRYKIQYKSEDETRPIFVVNSFIEVLNSTSKAENTEQLRLWAKQLEDTKNGQRDDLDEAKQALENFFLSRKPTPTQSTEANSLISEISSVQQNLRQLDVQTQSLNTEIQGLQKRLSLMPQEAHIAAALSADKVIAELQAQIYDLDTQMKNLSVELQPRHPDMVEVQNKINALEAQQQQRITDVLGSDAALNRNTSSALSIEKIRRLTSLDPARQELANKLSDLQTQKDYLQNQRGILAASEQRLKIRLSAFQKQYNLPRLELDESILRSDFEGLKKEYEQARLNFRRAQELLNKADSNWIRETGILQRNINTFPIVETFVFPPFGFLTGLILFAFVPLVILNDRLLNAEEVKAILRELNASDIPVKLIPTLPGNFGGRIALAVGRNARYLGEFEGLRTELATHSPVMITSIKAGDGKSSTAFNLALASAQTGRKTLLIELDLRSMSIASNLTAFESKGKVSEDPPSDSYYQDNLLDHIQSVEQFDKSMVLDEVDITNLFILPSKHAIQSLQRVLESNSVTDLFKEVSKHYDYVVVDAPSMSVDNAPRALLDNVKAFLLVARPGNSPADRFTEVVDVLTRYDKEKFAGIVVTDAGRIHKNLLDK